ncbi:hypothetical protein D9M68_577350 [compost metagenome]
MPPANALSRYRQIDRALVTYARTDLARASPPRRIHGFHRCCLDNKFHPSSRLHPFRPTSHWRQVRCARAAAGAVRTGNAVQADAGHGKRRLRKDHVAGAMAAEAAIFRSRGGLAVPHVGREGIRRVLPGLPGRHRAGGHRGGHRHRPGGQQCQDNERVRGVNRRPHRRTGRRNLCDPRRLPSRREPVGAQVPAEAARPLPGPPAHGHRLARGAAAGPQPTAHDEPDRRDRRLRTALQLGRDQGLP